jgi:chemotaxis protein methyltransferase CheR
MSTHEQAVGLDELAEAPSLNAAEFEQIRRLAQEHFGLDLKEGKQGLVVARLGKTLKRQGFTSFGQYYRHVTADNTGVALAELADALTTNFTSFLREPIHFEFLRRQVAPALAANGAGEIWSAASSTGEEPYSILFTLLEALGPSADVRVLATDISSRALQGVGKAVYQADRVDALPLEWRRKYFLRGNGKWQGWYRVKPEIRDRVICRRFNLVTDPLPSSRFAAIFCRNVMIYFNKTTQGQVVKRLASVLEPEGFLFIGHSESLAGLEHGLEYIQPALYRAPEKGRRG